MHTGALLDKILDVIIFTFIFQGKRQLDKKHVLKCGHDEIERNSIIS